MKFLTKIAALALGAVLPLAAAAVPAHADTIYDWSFTAASPVVGGSDFTGSGTLTISDAVSGSGVDTGFLITAITGTIDGSTIKKLIAVGGYEDNDNELFPDSSSFLDSNGVSFNDGDKINIFGLTEPGEGASDGYGEFVKITGMPGNFTGVGMLSISPVPEPASMALLGSGLAAVGMLRRRRRG